MHTDYEVDVTDANGETFTCYATYRAGRFSKPEYWLPILSKEIDADGFTAPYTFGKIRTIEDDK
jgi:hypothetical protein